MAAFLGTLHTVAGASSAQLTCSLPTCSVIGNIKCALVTCEDTYIFSATDILCQKHEHICSSQLTFSLPTSSVHICSCTRRSFIGLQNVKIYSNICALPHINICVISSISYALPL